MIKSYFLKTIIATGIVFTALFSEAQHDPYYTHFRFVQQAFNPAAAGVKENNICITGLSHFQYRGYSDQTLRVGSDGNASAPAPSNVAPETYNFNINTLLNIDKKGRHKMGVGITFINDQVGVMKTTTYKGALNYRMPIQGKFAFLAIGVEVGGTAFGYDDPKFKALDPADPNIPTTGGNKSKLDLGAGIYYQQKTLLGTFDNFYIGASYNHLNAAKYNFSVTMADGAQREVDMDFVRYLHINTGADWQLANPNWKLEPALMLKYNPKLQLDVSMTALYSNTLRVGLAYRTAADATSILLGYERGQLQVGYAYDITMTKIRKVSDGTHEIYVKYCFPISFPPPPDKIFRLTPRFMGRGAY